MKLGSIALITLAFIACEPSNKKGFLKFCSAKECTQTNDSIRREAHADVLPFNKKELKSDTIRYSTMPYAVVINRDYLFFQLHSIDVVVMQTGDTVRYCLKQ